jgi:hypothetical protein
MAAAGEPMKHTSNMDVTNVVVADALETILVVDDI